MKDKEKMDKLKAELDKPSMIRDPENEIPLSEINDSLKALNFVELGPVTVNNKGGTDV